MENQYQNGIAQDLRTPEKKALDYQHSDLAGAVILVWKEKDPKDWKKYIPREQNGSLSCVGQSCAKAFEVLGNGIESAHPIYRSRANFPSGGMWNEDAGKICKKIGTTTEALDKSQWQNETLLNRAITVATPTKIGGYIFVAPKDINAVAEAIALSGHCILIFHCNKSEWTAIPTYQGDVVNFGHAICAVDYFLYQGAKVILCEDSTGHFNSFDKNGQRLISENFLKARCSGAMYLTPLSPKPTHIFTKLLKIGMVNDEVKFLQLKLNIGADGLFGKKTKAAVINFQKAHGLVPDGIVGKLTNFALNNS